MGMKYYAVMDYGVIFTKTDLDFNKLKIALPDNADFADNNFDIENDLDLCDCFYDEKDCYHYAEYTGDAYLLSNDDAEVDLPSEFILGSTSHNPCFYEAKYKDYDELKQDLMDKFSKYLKDDFNWNERIIKFIGVVG